MRIPAFKSYTKKDVNEWIEIARVYLRRDHKLPDPMLELLRSVMLADPTLGIYFFAEIRKYPRLKNTLMVIFDVYTDDDPANDEPPAFMKHPGAVKKDKIAGQVHADLMFR